MRLGSPVIVIYKVLGMARGDGVSLTKTLGVETAREGWEGMETKAVGELLIKKAGDAAKRLASSRQDCLWFVTVFAQMELKSTLLLLLLQETESDFDNCAVCIEGYKPNDVVRILPCR